MVTALQAAGLTVTAVMIAKLLERYAAEQALLLTLLAGVLLTGAAVLSLMPVLNEIDNLLRCGGLDAAQTACIGKALGICCITQLAADVCKDAGEHTLTTAVLLTGKAALLMLALPLIQPLLRLLEEVLSCVTAYG